MTREALHYIMLQRNLPWPLNETQHIYKTGHNSRQYGMCTCHALIQLFTKVRSSMQGHIITGIFIGSKFSQALKVLLAFHYMGNFQKVVVSITHS